MSMQRKTENVLISLTLSVFPTGVSWNLMMYINAQDQGDERKADMGFWPLLGSAMPSDVLGRWTGNAESWVLPISAPGFCGIITC